MITALNGIIASSIASVSYDADAQLFFNAESSAGVSLTLTEKNAVNQWVVDSKASGIWTKMKAIYPIVGGTATSQKFNLKNPADTNAAYRLVFNGGWTHSSLGALPNGINAYASTFLIPNPVFGSGFAAIGIYINQSIATGTRPMGSTNMDIILGGGFVRGGNKASTSSTALPQSPNNGFIINSRTSSTSFYFMNRNRAFSTATVTAVSSYGTTDIVLGAFNANGTITSYSDAQIAFAFCSDGLSQSESLLLYQITEKYQVELGRSVHPAQSFYYNAAYNNETNLFLFSTQITDNTIQTATDTLVTDLKIANILTKMKALYPMVGGTATTHKYNLANSQDTDAAFRLVFAGGVTHSSSGVLFNGTNGWANTFLNMSTQYSNAYDVHLSANINSDFVGTLAQGHIGANVSGTQVNRLGASTSTVENSYLGTNSNNIAVTVTPTTHKGFWCGSRLSTTNHNLIDPTGTITTNTALIASSLPTVTIGLGCRRSSTNDYYSGFGYSFFSAGVGLTTTEMTAFKLAETNFQTALGRI